MEPFVIKEDMVDFQIFLQELAHCPRGVFPHIEAVDSGVCRRRQMYLSSSGHSGWSNAGKVPGVGTIRAVLRAESRKG